MCNWTTGARGLFLEGALSTLRARKASFQTAIRLFSKLILKSEDIKGIVAPEIFPDFRDTDPRSLIDTKLKEKNLGPERHVIWCIPTTTNVPLPLSKTLPSRSATTTDKMSSLYSSEKA